MARKVKIPKHRLERLQRKEARRNVNQLEKRRYYLIICEGEKTEPNYFRSLKNDLPRGVLEACQIRIEGTGYNTTSLVKKAIDMRLRYEKEVFRKIDKLWIVFDRDSFPAQDFNDAIAFCNNSGSDIDAAWTNEAFELWYLLHFQFFDTAIARDRYQEMLENNLKQFLGEDYRYEKNCTEMYGYLKRFGNLEFAINNARKLNALFTNRDDFANHNPGTRVHELIDELFSLNPKQL